ncbi:hypothetical protein AUK22_02115 [bacterium CG2_30_54_10]|nr:MAG: hypothetical protein AUK22_02115 [bacterium CG2_30_54_10]
MPAVGRSVPRKDAWDKVTGRAKFVDDYSAPGLLYAATVRSPIAYGRIKAIDTSSALAFPGVKAVFLAKDIPGKNVNPLVYDDQVFLAADEVRFHGEPIAIVVAENPEAAYAAADLVKLDLAPLKPVLSIREALDSDSSRIYKDNNVFTEYTITKGDANKAFSKAEKVFEREYETPYQEHAYLETQGMMAVPGPEGQMTVYGSMQCPFYVHDAVSQILGTTRNKVRVVQTTTGGGFGGKEDFPSIVAGQAAMAAQLLQRPVKLIFKREEDIIASPKRHPGLIRMKIGTDCQGKLISADIAYYVDGGAYATLSPIVLWRGTVHALGPYVCENVLIRSFAMATNKVPCGAYRGFGSPQVIFAGESIIDEIADELGIDPVEIRRINGLKLGDSTATNQKIDQSCGLMETIARATAAADWKKNWRHPSKRTEKIRKGIGVSTIYYGVGLGAGGKHLDRAGASMTIMKDGSVSCAVGNTEMGQGARTILAQIAADALGASYDLVNVIETDTAFVPDSGPTVASRTTFMSGNALISAGKELKTRLLPIAKDLLGAGETDEIEIIDGFASFKNPAKASKIAFQDLVKEMYSRRLMPSSFGWYVAPDTSFDKKTGQGDAYFVYSYCTNIAEVEVDMETGEIKVTRLISAHEMGKAINPQQVEGQIQGGALQGLGYCTMEEIRHDSSGRMLNNAFSTYILPTVEDSPEIVPIIVEHPYSEGPYGAKGFGEVPLMGIAPAVGNAVFNATGKRIRILPIKPEKLVDC